MQMGKTPKRGCHWYDTKLRQVARLQFQNLGSMEYPIIAITRRCSVIWRGCNCPGFYCDSNRSISKLSVFNRNVVFI